MFSVPAVLGMPAGFNVATTEIYQLLESYPPRTADATAWGVLLLAITALLTFAQAGVLGRRSFVTITGKAFRPDQHPPRARRLRAGMAWFYVALATVLPLIALLWAASSAFITADIRLMRFTPQHFVDSCATGPEDLARRRQLCTARRPHRQPGLFARPGGELDRGADALKAVASLLDQLSMIPLSMPAMVFALGLLWVYVQVPLPIYGTIAILLIAYTTHWPAIWACAPPARPCVSCIRNLEEAARVAGASWLRTMRKITLPLVQPAMLAAWVLLFVMSMQEVSSSILLLQQPQHRAVRCSVRPVGERQPRGRCRTRLPPTHRQLRHRRGRPRHASAPRICMSRDVAVETLTVAHGAIPAVRAISFTARRGELLTLLGPSGCGKTTTLRAIAGLETPRRGRIVIGGQTVFDSARGANLAPEHRGLGAWCFSPTRSGPT